MAVAFCVGLTFGYMLGDYLNDANVLISKGYVDDDTNPHFKALPKLINRIREDGSDRITLGVFTQRGLYLLPSLYPNVEVIAGLRDKETKKIYYGLNVWGCE